MATSVQPPLTPTASPRASTCTSCGKALIGLDWFRDTCAWCQPEDTALCPGCYGSGSAYRNAADIDGDDCPVCFGSGRITTRAGTRRNRQAGSTRELSCDGGALRLIITDRKAGAA